MVERGEREGESCRTLLPQLGGYQEHFRSRGMIKDILKKAHFQMIRIKKEKKNI